MNILHMVIDTEDSVNQPALTEALKAYQTVEYTTGAWLVKTDLSPFEMQSKLRGAVGAASIAIIPLNDATLNQAILPDQVKTFVGNRTAA